MATVLNKPKFLYRDRTLHDVTSVLDDGNTYLVDSQSQVSSADAERDFGSDLTQWPTKLAHNFFITSSEAGTGNETYAIRIDFASDNGFANLSNQEIFQLTRGDSGLLIFETPVHDQFMRYFYDVGGTTPSLIVAEAFYAAG